MTSQNEKNGCCIDETLTFSSSGAYGENSWIGYNLIDQERRYGSLTTR